MISFLVRGTTLVLGSKTHIFQASETLGATQGAEHATPALATPDVNSWPSEMLELRRNRHTAANMLVQACNPTPVAKSKTGGTLGADLYIPGFLGDTRVVISSVTGVQRPDGTVVQFIPVALFKMSRTQGALPGDRYLGGVFT